MLHLDLFSGIGGFALAAKWSNFKTIAFIEKDFFCQKVLKKHWPNVPIFDDIKNFNGIECDLITAGFPCQPFSLAGQKKGVKDDRYLWPDTMRIIRESKPTWCILENVPGIISHLDPILEDLEREGYTWRAYIIPACAIEAPHKRERVWVIAYSNGITSQQTDKSTESKSVKKNSWKRYTGLHRRITARFNWKEGKSPFFGVDDGLPDRVDRNKSLGNAIVPQIAYALMQILKEWKP